jgi:MFS family permease
VLLATENAPANKRAWYGMFPQYGAPLGFLCSTGVFLLLSQQITEADFLAWGWRIPFIASSLLVLVGLYIRLRLEETPAFKQAIEHNERVRMPMMSVLTRHTRLLLLATFSGVATFAVFYLMTVFTLGWATSHMGYTRQEFLILQMIATIFLALTILLSALGSDRYGRRLMLMIAAVCVIAFGACFGLLFESGSKMGVLVFLCMGMSVMGLTYGPLGTALSEYFPTAIRYTGASVSFNLAGIIGGSFTPYFASTLANKYSVAYVGYYMAAAGLITLAANWLMPKEVS